MLVIQAKSLFYEFMRFLVLMAYVNREGSDEPTQSCSLATAFPAHRHNVWTVMKAQDKI